MSAISNFIKSIRPILTINSLNGIPNIAFEISKKIELDNSEIEDRINQLDDIKDKLIKAAEAINLLSKESKQKKADLETIKIKIDEINKEKETAEKILEVDHESFARLLFSTNKKTEKRSIVIGVIIGFITGTISSYLVWYLTKN
jgi:septal ring factor EnvC (AmiA/AmiB activator)